MNDDPAARNEPAKPRGAFGGLRRHLLAYAAVNIALFLINLFTSGPWWFFWPMFGWGIALTAHWLYIRSINTDDEWAEDRTADIRQRAYDLGHIQDIEKRYDKALSHGQPTMKARDKSAAAVAGADPDLPDGAE